MKNKLKIVVEEYREMYEDNWTSNGTILIELFEELYQLIEEESDD